MTSVATVTRGGCAGDGFLERHAVEDAKDPLAPLAATIPDSPPE